jgi:hypothetical protein
MAEMIIVEPFDMTFGGAAPTLSVGRGSGGANLISNDPREIWVDSAVGTTAIDIDFGAARDWDTIALINTNGNAATQISISGGATLTTTTYLAATALRVPSEDVADANGPALFYSATTLNGRYIRINVINPSGAPATVGRVVVGKSWKPSYPREQGAGRPPLDTGARQRLDDGGLAVVSGRLVSGFKWVFADLAPADVTKLWGIVRRRRTTEPVLLVEDPNPAVAEGVHYGAFAELDSYERRDAEKSRMALTVEDWA